MNKLLVLTSTYPKNKGDSIPSFVFELNNRLADFFETYVLVPHFRGGKFFEQMEGGNIFRFPYAPPKFEKIAYGSGIFENLRKSKVNYALVPLFILSQFVWAYLLTNIKKIDIIHAHWIFPQGFIAVLVKRLSRRKIEIVCTSHGSDLFRLNGHFFRWLLRWIVARCDALTVVSSAMQRHCQKNNILCRQIKVIPMGIDIKGRFKVRGKEKDARKGALFVGRLVEKKGILDLLEAVKILRNQGVAIDLTVAGSGPLFSKCKKQVTGHGLTKQVTLLGAVGKSDLPALYQKNKICVVPSVQEGLGLVIVEALASGCVVLASELPAIHDVVDDGVNAIFFQAGDPVSIANALKRVMEDEELCAKLSNNARSSVINKFDWQCIARRYRLLLESVLL